MHLKLRRDDHFRVSCDSDENNFIDIQQVGYEAMAMNLFPLFHYIEIRSKDNNLRLFTFKKKSHKKEYDFGNWENAEIVFTWNKVSHK